MIKQHEEYKSLIGKNFDGNISKMKAASLIQLIRNDNQ